MVVVVVVVIAVMGPRGQREGPPATSGTEATDCPGAWPSRHASPARGRRSMTTNEGPR